MCVRLSIAGRPTPGGSKTVGFTKAGKHFVRDSSGNAGKQWRETVQTYAMKEMIGRKVMDGPLRLDVTFFVARPKKHFRAQEVLRDDAPAFPTGKPDVTKLLRALEDSLNGIVFTDDSLIVDQTARKRYGAPGAQVTVAKISTE